MSRVKLINSIFLFSFFLLNKLVFVNDLLHLFFTDQDVTWVGYFTVKKMNLSMLSGGQTIKGKHLFLNYIKHVWHFFTVFISALLLVDVCTMLPGRFFVFTIFGAFIVFQGLGQSYVI